MECDRRSWGKETQEEGGIDEEESEECGHPRGVRGRTPLEDVRVSESIEVDGYRGNGRCWSGLERTGGVSRWVVGGTSRWDVRGFRSRWMSGGQSQLPVRG